MVRSVTRSVAIGILGPLILGCAPSAPPSAVFEPGTADDSREIIVLARDYTFSLPVIDLVPGESVVFQIVNGGLVVHELVLGGSPVQDAWEAAEAAVAGAPPGPTPVVSVPPELAGLRIVVESGGRVDERWTVPPDAASEPGGWFAGCHIPGHWAEGMVVPVRFVGPDGLPLATPTLRTGVGSP